MGGDEEIKVPVVFEYMNYRHFLGDFYQAKKAQSAKYSYRYFTQRAGLKSPIHLKLIIDGKRNLTPEKALAFAKAFGFKPAETRFFTTLVAMNQAKTTEERAHHYERLSRMPRYRASRRLERAHYDYYRLWYCVPIRELVGRADFRDDPAWIAKQMRPSITAQQASEAIAHLLALGLLVRDAETRRLVQADALISTGPAELHSLSLRSFHREMLHLASASLDGVPLEEREVRGVTLRLTASQLVELKKWLFEMGERVLQHDGRGDGAEAVYHFSVQLFPLTFPSEDTT